MAPTALTEKVAAMEKQLQMRQQLQDQSAFKVRQDCRDYRARKEMSAQKVNKVYVVKLAQLVLKELLDLSECKVQSD
jgi:hypothetical protein